jgi:RNA polymerase sigma-70 factor, ECF subfamily
VSARLRLVLPPEPDAAPGTSAADLFADLVARKPRAERWLLETQGRRVERILARVLGNTRSIEDLTQEVFVRVFARVGEVRDPEALDAFVASVAVFVAREAIRKRRRHRWLAFLAPRELPEVATRDDVEAREAVSAFYRVLDELDADDRVAFALRYVDGMELEKVAMACRCSLATVKRRIDRASKRFVSLCRDDAVLLRWLEEGERWA